MFAKEYIVFFKKLIFPGNKTLIILTFFLTIVSGMLSGIGLGLYIPVINYFMGNNEKSIFFSTLSKRILVFLHLPDSFLSLISVATATIILGALITYLTMLCSGYLTFRGYRAVKLRLIDDLLERPYQYFVRQRYGKIVSVIADQAILSSSTIDCAFRFFTNLCVGLVYFASLLLISVYLTLAMFLFGGAMLISNQFFCRNKEKLSQTFLDLKHEQANLFTETMIGIKTIKSMGIEYFRKSEIASVLNHEQRAIFKMHNVHHLQPLTSKVLTTIFASVSILFSLKVFALPGAAVIVFLMVATRLGSALQEINYAWMDLAQNLPNVRVVMQYITGVC